MRRRVRSARDHAVGEAQVHHHRAEVGDIRDDVGGLLVRDALVRAQACVFGGEEIHRPRVERAQHLRAGQVEAEFDGAAADLGILAQDREVGDAAREDGRRGFEHAIVAALGKDDALARGARGLQKLILEHQRRHDRGVSEAEGACEFLGVDVLLEERERRVEAALGARREAPPTAHDAYGRVVGVEVGLHDRQRRVEADHEVLDDVRQGEGTVEDDARDRRECAGRVREEEPEENFRAIGRDDDDRPLGQTRQDVVERHARHDDVEHLAGEQVVIAAQEATVELRHEVAHRRRDEIDILRDRPHADGRLARAVRGRRIGHDLADRRVDLVETVGVGPVRDHREQLRAVLSEIAESGHDEADELFGGAGDAEPQAIPFARAAVEHGEHGRSEVRGDPRVVAELTRRADVGEVGPDDDDSVALGLHGLEPLDDLRERGIRVVSHFVVGDADRLLVLELDADVVQQHFEHVVALDGGSRDRAEDPDTRRRAAEGVQDAEDDGGLARETLGRRDVDALGHAVSLRRPIEGWPGSRPGEKPGGQPRRKERLSANPAEPGYPCYVSVLGELAWMPPRGELLGVYPTSGPPRATPG